MYARNTPLQNRWISPAHRFAPARRSAKAVNIVCTIAVLAFLLLSTCSRAVQLRIAIFPEQNARGQAAIRKGLHDLYAFAKGLKKLGHRAVVIAELPEEGMYDLLANTQGALFDVVLAQGEPAKAVADFAARLQIPVVRFVGESSSKSPQNVPEPLFERPAALIFANPEDLVSFGDVMEETVRSVIPLSSLEDSIHNIHAANQVVALAQDMFQRILNPPLPLEQKSLGLVMIVKNEVATINLTLASMRDMIDYWTIVDTGSIDGTQDAIRKYMEGYPGVLIEEPFVDFSTTRNYALRAHGNKTAYTFMPDADFVVNNAWRLRLAVKRLQTECLHRSIPACAKALQIRLSSGPTVYYGPRVFPTQGVGTDDGWRYFFPVHETASHLGIDYMNQRGVYNVMHFPIVTATRLPITHNKSRTRWKSLDLPLLTAEHNKKPNNTRIVFYLAQTLDLLGDLPAALAMYQKRISLGGWQHEVFEAHMRRVAALLEQWPSKGRIKHDRMPLGTDPRPDFLEAHRLYPARAEPLIWMCWHHQKLMKACKRGNPDTEVCWLRERAAAYYYARKAAVLPMPEDGLFINKPVYDHRSLDSLVHHAFYAAKHLGAAQLLALKAAEYVQMKRRPNQHAGNLQLYQDRTDALLTQ